MGAFRELIDRRRPRLVARDADGPGRARGCICLGRMGLHSSYLSERRRGRDRDLGVGTPATIRADQSYRERDGDVGDFGERKRAGGRGQEGG